MADYEFDLDFVNGNLAKKKNSGGMNGVGEMANANQGGTGGGDEKGGIVKGVMDLFAGSGGNTATAVGSVGSLIQGIGTFYDALMQRKYQKKMIQFAEQDRAEKKQRQTQTDSAISGAFKDVFKK